MVAAADSAIPSDFIAACDSLKAAQLRSELQLVEIAAPASIAPHAVAYAADVRPSSHASDSEWGTGRFIALYDPEQPDEWGGPWRVICFAQAPLELEIGADPFVTDVAWSWLIDALETRGASYHSPSGTATRTQSKGFGELADEGEGSQIELRASWSPRNGDLTEHLEAWGELLAMLAGLPPGNEDVSLLAARRPRD